MAAPDELLIAKLDACTKHARELLLSAQAVFSSGQHNIAYHLGVLALEELGKRELIAVESMVGENAEVPATWPKKHQLDHQQKLFWCFFGGAMFRLDMTKEQFEGARGLSRSMHMKRLGALYVDVQDDAVSIPSLAVTREETESVLALADVRVRMAENEVPRANIPEEELAAQRWFLKMTEDLEHRKMIFSKGSMEKLAELNDTPAWVGWLKEQFEEAKRQGEAAIALELERGKSLPAVGKKPKWKVRFRVHSASHSIRPNVLTEWNQSANIVKLYPVSGSGGAKKKELIVELVLLDNVPLQRLDNYAWGLARQFVVALNIATLGFWWWDLPASQTEWFERIEDLDRPEQDIKADRPWRKIDWGEGRVLTKDDIERLKVTFAALSVYEPGAKYGPLDAYVSGLTLLAGSNVHLPLEIDAFGSFLKSLRLMMIEAGELKEEEPIEPALVAFAEKRGAADFPERDVVLAIVRAYDDSMRGGPATGPRLKPDYVSTIKLFVDWYYIEKLQPAALQRLSDEVATYSTEAK